MTDIEALAAVFADLAHANFARRILGLPPIRLGRIIRRRRYPDGRVEKVSMEQVFQ